MALSTEKSTALDHRMMLTYDFAVINSLQVEPEARADLEGLSIMPARFQGQDHLFPLLVELRTLSDSQRIDMIDRMATWQASRGTPYFSALLTCPDGKDVLCRHLIKHSDVRLPNGRRDVLRLHDPRLFHHLLWMLRPEQIVTLLGNIACWTWHGQDGVWHSLRNTDASPARRLENLRIAPDQWPLLLRLPDQHAVIAALRRQSPQLTDDARLARQVNNALAEAERSMPGSRPADRQLFAEHAIRFGTRLHRHPEYQTRLAAVRAGKRSYFAAFADLGDETLQAWAATSELAKECP